MSTLWLKGIICAVRSWTSCGRVLLWALWVPPLSALTSRIAGSEYVVASQSWSLRRRALAVRSPPGPVCGVTSDERLQPLRLFVDLAGTVSA